jgi:hypothetical protein
MADNGDAQEGPSDTYRDPVIEFYMKDIDVTLLRENLKLTPQQRFEKFERFMDFVYELREAGKKMRAKEGSDGPKLS